MCQTKSIHRDTLRLVAKMLRRQYSDAATQIRETGTFAIDSAVARDALRSLSRRLTLPAAEAEYRRVSRQKSDIPPPVKEEWERQIESRIWAFMEVKAALIDDTTRRDVLRVMQRGQQEGLNFEQIARILEREARDMSRNRARVIARTEQTGAQNAGAFFGALSAGATHKTWVTFGDDRVREPLHTSLHEVTIPINDLFESGGSRGLFPGDISWGAMPEWLINCRCLVIYSVR